MPMTVLVADDHPATAQGITHALADHGVDVCEVVTSPDQIVDAFRRHHPDVLVTEVRLAGRDALKSLESLKSEFPGSKVVVFSAYSNPTHIARASALSCKEYILKTAAPATLFQAIENAAADKPVPGDSLLAKTRRRIRSAARPADDDIPLTNRELQVLQHVSMGLSNREVGKSLGISVETVKEHVQNILRKLDVNDRTQAAVWAVKRGLV